MWSVEWVWSVECEVWSVERLWSDCGVTVEGAVAVGWLWSDCGVTVK